MGTPKSSKIVQNHQKSSPKCPLGRYFTQPLKKYEKLVILGYPEPSKSGYLVRVALILTFPTGPAKGAKNTSKMPPFGHPLGPLAAKMPLWGRLEGSLKFNVFLEGSRCSLLLQNGAILGPASIRILTLFWYLFGVGTPKSQSTQKSNKNTLKCPKTSPKIVRNDWHRV